MCRRHSRQSSLFRFVALFMVPGTPLVVVMVNNSGKKETHDNRDRMIKKKQFNFCCSLDPSRCVNRFRE